MNQYKLISKKGEGTFSEVLKAQSLKTGNFVAIKCMKNHFNSIEQVQRLKEIQALKKLSPHQHIVKLIEVLYDEPTGRLALVFELMDQNLYEAIRGRKQYLNPQKAKFYMYQLLIAIDHLHKKGIFHRDIKPENILLLADHIKLADFGSCKGIYSEHPYTEYISTRWYRAPECLLTDGYYSSKMDLWGVGCVMFEVMALFPLFPGNDELDQVHKIHNVLGTPNPKILEEFQQHATHMEFNFPMKKGTGIEKLAPHIPKECIDLIYKLLVYDPKERITAEEALRHPYFKDLYQMDQENLLFQNALLGTKNISGNANSMTRLDVSQNNETTKNTLKQQYQQLGGSNVSNANFNQTLKQQQQVNTQPENVFYPVLSIKKATNPYHKKKASNKKITSQYPSLNVNLKIEGTYNNSGTDEEIDSKNKPQFLPPIKNQSNNMNSIMQIDAKINLYKGQNTLKAKQINYGVHQQHVVQKKNKKFNEDYIIFGKKANYKQQQQQQAQQ